jgi:hypothetical protein
VEIRDYNGTGEWSADAVRQRYQEYRERYYGQGDGRRLRPQEHIDGNVRWVFPIIDCVVDGIKAGDPACVDLGVEFIESGHKQPFGRILHAKVARALRQSSLNPEHVTRLRARILAMLIAGQVPHEYHEYAKLLRRIGLGEAWAGARQSVDEGNQYVMRYVKYFDRFGSVAGV